MTDVLRLREDAAPAETPVPFADFLGASNANAVRIEPGDDARALLPVLDRVSFVEIAFPMFGDGRGYSAARILREAGYAGELRASGDVLIDQIGHMRRCGFDSFAPDAPLDPALLDAAFARFPYPYQKAVDPQTPVWALRHGTQNG